MAHALLHANYCLFGENPPFAVQVTKTDREVADHCAFVVGNELTLNMTMMMRLLKKDGKEYFNNGFSENEALSNYHIRICRIIEIIGDTLKKHPRISRIKLQEAPIQEAGIYVMAEAIKEFFPPQWQQSVFWDTTNYGLMSFTRMQPGAQHYSRDEELAQQYGRYSERCLTVTDNQDNKESNIHAVHGKQQTRDSLAVIFRAIIEDMFEGNTTTHRISGDFNTNSAEIREIMERTWDETLAEWQALHPNAQPFELNMQFTPSPNGHRKTDGSMVDADGVLKITKKPAEEYGFHFHSSSRMYGRITVALGAAGTTATAATAFLEDSEAAVSILTTVVNTKTLGIMVCGF